MHLLVLSLLVVGVLGHSGGYRTNLLTYAPSRGEFPVEGGLAQGFVHYLDATGAENLVAYNYPEPLVGLRRLSYGSVIHVNPILRTSIDVLPNNKSDDNREQIMLFRAWCEQRYNALQAKLEQLRATGKQPSANILAQFEPLEKIIKEDAFETVSSLSPEVQRARDEQLRIWNTVRLQVKRAEEAHLQIAQPQQAQYIFLKQPALNFEQNLDRAKIATSIDTHTSSHNSPQPVQETPEVLRARQEHLLQFNAILQRHPSSSEEATVKVVTDIQQPTTILLKTLSLNAESQQLPQPLEETPEVKRARDQNLKYYNEAIFGQISAVDPLHNQSTAFASLPPPIVVKSTFNTPAQQQTTQETLEVKQAREEHLVVLNKAKIRAEDKLADIDDMIRYEERERLRELKLRREEDKLAELEQHREEDNVKDDSRLGEAEHINLQHQEQQRIENERYEEEQRLITEQRETQEFKTAVSYDETKKAMVSTQDNAFKLYPQMQPVQQQQQLQQNGFILGIQTNKPSALRSIGAASASTIAEQLQNPFLLRHTEQQAITRSVALPLANSIAMPQPLEKPTAQEYRQSELDKATSENFRAHENALKQLRLTNDKNPWNPYCN